MKYIICFMALLFLVSCESNSTSEAKTSNIESELNSIQQNEFVQVYKSDGTKQCQSTAISLKSMSQVLVSSGIDILCSHKDDDSLIHPNSCGSPSGSINVFKINTVNLADVISMGFK